MIDGKQLFDELWAFYRQQLSPEGMSALDFAQFVTYLLFLKIDDERSRRPVNQVQVVPDGLGWQSLVQKDGSVLEDQFRHVLQECGKLDPRSADPGQAGGLSCGGARLALHAGFASLPHEGCNRRYTVERPDPERSA